MDVLAWFEGLDVAVEGACAEGCADGGEVGTDGDEVGVGGDVRVEEEGADFAGEGEFGVTRVLASPPVEGLYAERVAGEEERFALCVVPGEGEHATEHGEGARAEVCERQSEGFGVATGVEVTAETVREMGAEVGVVVDFAVVDEHAEGLVVASEYEGLRACEGGIKNGEAAVCELDVATR